MTTASPTQSNIQAALTNFLQSVLPAGVTILSGLQNRVAEPKAGSFLVLTAISMERLSTNIDAADDVSFQGSISGATLSVTQLLIGSIVFPASLFGSGVLPNSVIKSQLTGAVGGTGSYVVYPAQTIAGPVKLASGAKTLQLKSKICVQIDFHSADLTAQDWANTVSAALRDPYGVSQFLNQGQPWSSAIAPLYADDPKYMPFINEAQQYEWRWVLDCYLQVNQTITLPLQYADALAVTLVDVDASYPP